MLDWEGEKKLKWKAQKGLEEMISSSWQWEQNYRKEVD